METRTLIAPMLAAALAVASASCGCGAGDSGYRPAPPEPLMPVTITERTLTAAEVAARLWPDAREVRFEATSLAERQVIEAWIPRLVAGGALPAEVPAAEVPGRAGFALERWQVGEVSLWALVEAAGRERGAGAYLVRAAPAAGAGLIVQAPHAYYDRHTATIALAVLLADPGARALFANTIHRYQAAPGQRQRDGDRPADLAHAPEHGFTVATAAAVRAARAPVVQIHGFGDRPALRGASAVVSAGSRRQSTARSRRVADAVGQVLGTPALAYPEAARVLGGTTNAQRRVLRAPEAFVHVELSAPARTRLVGDPELLARFAAAIVAAAGGAD